MRNFAVAILTIIAVCAFGIAKGQTTTNKRGYDTWGQMFQVGKTTYNNTFLDTATNTTVLYLYICSGSVNSTDTGAVLGAGTLEIRVQSTKISGAPQGKIVLESSPTGAHGTWSRDGFITSNAYGDSVIIDSVSLSIGKVWRFTKPTVPYYRVAITTTGTQASSWRAWYYLRRENYIVTTR